MAAGTGLSAAAKEEPERATTEVTAVVTGWLLLAGGQRAGAS